MCVHCVTSEENTFLFGEVGSDALADLVGCPPVAILVGELIGGHGTLSRFEDHLGCNIGAIELSFVSSCELIDGKCEFTLSPPFSVVVIWI